MCDSCEDRMQRLRRIANEFRAISSTGGDPSFSARMLATADELDGLAEARGSLCGAQDDVVWDDVADALQAPATPIGLPRFAREASGR